MEFISVGSLSGDGRLRWGLAWNFNQFTVVRAAGKQIRAIYCKGARGLFHNKGAAISISSMLQAEVECGRPLVHWTPSTLLRFPVIPMGNATENMRKRSRYEFVN